MLSIFEIQTVGPSMHTVSSITRLSLCQRRHNLSQPRANDPTQGVTEMLPVVHVAVAETEACSSTKRNRRTAQRERGCWRRALRHEVIISEQPSQAELPTSPTRTTLNPRHYFMKVISDGSAKLEPPRPGPTDAPPALPSRYGNVRDFGELLLVDESARGDNRGRSVGLAH